MVLLTDLIDLSNPSAQCFTLPKPLISYIVENSILLPSQKLMRSCKTLKLLHLRKSEGHIKSLDIFPSAHEFGIESYYRICRDRNGRHFDIKIDANSIKIFETLNLQYTSVNKFKMLMEKLDLSQTKDIYICMNFAIEEIFLEKLFQPSVETLNILIHPSDKVNPALLAFQRCLNLKKINVSYTVTSPVRLITKEIFKQMNQIKRKASFDRCYFSSVSDVNIEDLTKFVDNHMSTKSDIYFNFIDLSELRSMKESLVKIEEKRILKGTFILLRYNLEVHYKAQL